MKRLDVAPGVAYWPECLGTAEQATLLKDVLARAAEAPFYRPAMPGSGKPMSVEMTNFGPLGWMTDQAKGYRYEPVHPVTGTPWPKIPDMLLALWDYATGYPAPPEACLVNLYRAGTRMGLHRDQDEEPRCAGDFRFPGRYRALSLRRAHAARPHQNAQACVRRYADVRGAVPPDVSRC